MKNQQAKHFAWASTENNIFLLSPMRYAEGLAKEPLEHHRSIPSPRLKRLGGWHSSLFTYAICRGASKGAARASLLYSIPSPPKGWGTALLISPMRYAEGLAKESCEHHLSILSPCHKRLGMAFFISPKATCRGDQHERFSVFTHLKQPRGASQPKREIAEIAVQKDIHALEQDTLYR